MSRYKPCDFHSYRQFKELQDVKATMSDLQKQIRVLDKEKKTIQSFLINQFGRASTLQTPRGTKLVLNKQDRAGYTIQPFTIVTIKEEV